MYTHKELWFQGVDHTHLYDQSWNPDERTRAELVAAPGAGEYISYGRFGIVIDDVLPSGIAFDGADLCGHGKSGGPRGHMQKGTDSKVYRS